MGRGFFLEKRNLRAYLVHRVVRSATNTPVRLTSPPGFFVVRMTRRGYVGRMKRKKKKPASPDAEALRGLLLAMMSAIGHGGLTYLSQALGMSPSALRKRLLRPGGGFDAATMSAVAFVVASKAESLGPAISYVVAPGYYITKHAAPDGSEVIGWIADPSPEPDAGTLAGDPLGFQPLPSDG